VNLYSPKISLQLEELKSASSDESLFKLLSSELQRLLPPEIQENEEFLLRTFAKLPRGLRAMAATHRLDVSMALDDLGWHFYNFGSPALCEETQKGLRELEATETAEIFDQAWALTKPNWEVIQRFKTQASPQETQTSLQDFGDWYKSSGLATALKPLNQRLWEIISTQPAYGLMQYWLAYARKYPERLVANSSGLGEL
jgi:hypothetical protein